MAHSIDTVVVGGGQAGLSVSWHLKRAGREHVVLDRGRIGDTWRNRWDNFYLVSPNKFCRLPGFSYDGNDPQGFMHRDQIVAYVERFAASFNPPYREEVAVDRISAGNGPGKFELTTSDGTISAENIFITIGTHQHPKIPSWHRYLPDGVLGMHTSDYRNSAQLPDGAVFVVGSGQSGCQVAEDLQRAGRKVHLAVGKAGRIPRTYRGRDIFDWDDLTGNLDRNVHEHPKGTAVRFRAHPHLSGRDGGYTVNLRKMARHGTRLHGKVLGVADGCLHLSDDLAKMLDYADEVCRTEMDQIDQFISQNGLSAPQEQVTSFEWQPKPEPPLLNLAEANISTVIYATGFQFDFGWIDLPIFDERGYPRYSRGVTDIPGLYFCGLHWMHTQGSGLFCGVAKDAKYVVQHMLEEN